MRDLSLLIGLAPARPLAQAATRFIDTPEATRYQAHLIVTER